MILKIPTKRYTHNWLHYFNITISCAWLQFFCRVLFLGTFLSYQIANYFNTPNQAYDFIISVFLEHMCIDKIGS
jgi:hypothetical protein